MTAFKPQQRHITIEGREFHFVSYDSVPADPKKDQPGQPAMWYLMVEGRRCPVFPCEASLSEEALDAALTEWTLENALAGGEAPVAETPAARGPGHRQQNWWGPY